MEFIQEPSTFIPGTENFVDLLETPSKSPRPQRVQLSLPSIPEAFSPVSISDSDCSTETPPSSNPLFSDLQAILREECQAHTSPSTLIAASHTARDPAVPISVRMGLLQGRFLSLESRASLPVGMRVQDLQHVYRVQSASTESARLNALQRAASSPWHYPSINQYYDTVHHQLIDRVEKSLALLDNPESTQLSTCNILTPTSSLPGQPTAPSFLPSLAAVENQGPSYLAPSQPAPVPSSLPLPATRPSRPRFTPFSDRAVKVMLAWYERHEEHPYPSYDTAEVLATAGGITVEQVKKWFSNRRRRAGKTKTLTEIARRRKRCREDREQEPAAKQHRCI